MTHEDQEETVPEFSDELSVEALGWVERAILASHCDCATD